MTDGQAKPVAEKRKVRATGAETQLRILDASIDVFAEMGFELASMRDIADAAGVTPASIYLYFADKERLYEAACRTCFDRSTVAILGCIDPATSALGQLRGFVRGMAQTLIRDSNATRLFEREVIAGSRNRLDRTGSAFRLAFGKALDLVVAATGADHAEGIAISMFALTLGLIQFSQTLTRIDGAELPFHRDADALARQVMDTIFPGVTEPAA